VADNIYTADDLKTMQAWPLSRKIQVTQAKIIEWYERFNGQVAVNFSGGVDSTVLLYLARRCYTDIPAVFVDTTLEFPELVDFVKRQKDISVLKPQFCKTCVNCSSGCFARVIKEFGYCFPSKDISMTVHYAQQGSKWAVNCFQGLNKDGTESPYKKSTYIRWHFLVDSKFKISDKCCWELKEKPLNKWHKAMGYVPIVGTLASESRRRRGAWLQTGCNSFSKKKPISKPLSFWTHNDILHFLLDYRIPYASVYGEIIEGKNGMLTTTGEKRTGCSLCLVGCHLDKTNKYQRLKRTHPDIWNFGMNSLGMGEFLDFIGIDYGKADTSCPSEK
jgi:3'-phosphoadenosine 5'-phosphosulfate sulfotransferase (PAPS reductase)/FAD synthetase